MKKLFIIALVLLGIPAITNAQITILEARGKALGSVVTVAGIVTNSSEFGPIRYIQDNTAAIAAYGPLVNLVNKGDSVTITGTLKNYNGLLELDPLATVDIRSSGNPIPEPVILTPAQVGEAYESWLVQINNASFPDAGGIFAGNKTYRISANGNSVNIYVRNGQDIVGKPIPHGLVNLTAIVSQFTFTGSGGYQLLPRTFSDIHKTSAIYLTGPLNNTDYTKNSLTFDWTTNITGTTEMFYGSSVSTVMANKTVGIGGATGHNIALTGLPAGQVIWTQAFSVNEMDTAFSGIMPFATISNSSGDIKVYFSTAVDNSYSTGVNAIYLNQTIDDTLINYINRAKSTIDMAIYNLNNSGLSNISSALKAAAARGVTVRVIGCGTTANLGIKNDLAGSAVNIFLGPNNPARRGLMHNKFVLFDTESADANLPVVWTGSTNLTSGQINVDANNVIIVQDQSLARAYKIEFEEMWGSSGNTANSVNARFGSAKKNNTPHDFIINGKRVECYFSPTDGVNAQIIKQINTTNNDLSIATMLLTRDEIASAIASARQAGNNVNMLTDIAANNSANVNTTLLNALGSTHYIYYKTSGIMHHKYMIIDQGAPTSDPMVLTGSHNWSAAADNDNDENTLIIHDATISNIYYQDFAKLFTSNNGVLTSLQKNETSGINRLQVYPNPVHNGIVKVSCNMPSAGKGTLQLLDVTGKIRFENTVMLNTGENILDYSFPGSPKGLYFIKLTTANAVWNQKVLFK